MGGRLVDVARGADGGADVQRASDRDGHEGSRTRDSCPARRRSAAGGAVPGRVPGRSAAADDRQRGEGDRRLRADAAVGGLAVRSLSLSRRQTGDVAACAAREGPVFLQPSPLQRVSRQLQSLRPGDVRAGHTGRARCSTTPACTTWTAAAAIRPTDRGLIDRTQKPDDMGRFRAPTLRNVAVTAPYMHDGSVPTLEAAIAHYASGGVNSPYKSDRLKGFTLTAQADRGSRRVPREPDRPALPDESRFREADERAMNDLRPAAERRTINPLMAREEIVTLFARRTRRMGRPGSERAGGDPRAAGRCRQPDRWRARRPSRDRACVPVVALGFPDLVFKSEELIIDGNRVVEIAQLSGTHEGEFFGAAPRPSAGSRFPPRS